MHELHLSEWIDVEDGEKWITNDGMNFVVAKLRHSYSVVFPKVAPHFLHLCDWDPNDNCLISVKEIWTFNLPTDLGILIDGLFVLFHRLYFKWAFCSQDYFGTSIGSVKFCTKMICFPKKHDKLIICHLATYHNKNQVTQPV